MKINDNILNEVAAARDKITSKEIEKKGTVAYDEKLKTNNDEIEILKKEINFYNKLEQHLKAKAATEEAFEEADQNLTAAVSSKNEKTIFKYKNRFKKAKERLDQNEKRLIDFKEKYKTQITGFFQRDDIKYGKISPAMAIRTQIDNLKEKIEEIEAVNKKLIKQKEELEKKLGRSLSPIMRAASTITPGTGRTRHKLEENCKITNNSNVDVSQLENIVARFYPYVKEKLKFDKDAKLNLISDPENAKDPWGKTAYYNPQAMEITIFVDGRHPKDMLRSISHELVHHAQNCRGEFDKTQALEQGYAQKDPHMRRMEGEAYLLGNGFLVRDFEDYLKSQQNQNLTENKKMKGLTKEQLKTVFENTIKRVAEEVQIPVEESYADVYPAKRDEDIIKEFGEEEMYGMYKADCSKKHKGNLQAIKDCMDAAGMGASSSETSDTEIMQAIDHALGQKFTNYHARSEALETAIESEQDPARRQHLEDLADQHDEYVAAAHMDLEESLTSKKNRLLFERLTKKWTK